MIVKPNRNYLIRKLLQDKETTGNDNYDYFTSEIVRTELVEITDPVATSKATAAVRAGTLDAVLKNVTSTLNPSLSTHTTMSNFDKNKEMLEDAAKKLKSMY